MVFSPTRRSYPLANEHATQFKRLCGAVIATYPHLLSRPQRDDRMIQYATGQAIASEWVLKYSSEELKLLHNDNNSTASPALVSMAQSDRYALKMEPDAKVSFHAHPCLTRLVQAWGGTKRWKPSRKLYKRFIREPRRQKGFQEHQARAAKWEEEAHGI